MWTRAYFGRRARRRAWATRGNRVKDIGGMRGNVEGNYEIPEEPLGKNYFPDSHEIVRAGTYLAGLGPIRANMEPEG